MTDRKRAMLIDIITKALEEEGSAGGNAAPQDVGRLPPEAIASMPAGYKVAGMEG